MDCKEFFAVFEPCFLHGGCLEEEKLLKRIKQCVAEVEEEKPMNSLAMYTSVQKYFLMGDGEIFYELSYSQRIPDPSSQGPFFFEFGSTYYFEAKLEGSDWKVDFVYDYDDKKLHLTGIGKNDESVMLQFEHNMDSNNLDHLLNDQRDGWFRDVNNSIPMNEIDQRAFDRFSFTAHRLGL
mmetsp:Transcript_6972/g.13884  ORF Transcript_6972/g.13884 Transcript_6972/m.13884 type:complete len:180 (+) Transcript_6972:50-589(+)